MTDNEIIKALECCGNLGTNSTCEECPCNNYTFDCGNKLSKQALDLINRQRREIVSADGCIKLLTKSLDKKCDECIERIRSEAIKEFAERLKERGTPVTGKKGFEGVSVMCSNLIIDNLVKQMTESEGGGRENDG